MSSIQPAAYMSPAPISPQTGLDSPNEPQKVPQEPNTGQKILRRRAKSDDLKFERHWGHHIDKRVDQETDEILLDVGKEYAAGEQLPSQDAIASVHFGTSWSELREKLRATEKAEIKRRENQLSQMQPKEPVLIEEGKKLRNGKRLPGFGPIRGTRHAPTS